MHNSGVCLKAQFLQSPEGARWPAANYL